MRVQGMLGGTSGAIRLAHSIVELLERELGRPDDSPERCRAALAALVGAIGIVIFKLTGTSDEDAARYNANSVAQAVVETVEDILFMMRFHPQEVH